jgi:hypothetical protein
MDHDLSAGEQGDAYVSELRPAPLTFTSDTGTLNISGSVVNHPNSVYAMQSKQTESQQEQQAPQDEDAITRGKIIRSDEVAGDKIEGDLIAANFENVSGGKFVVGKNIDARHASPIAGEAEPVPAGPQEGVSVRIDNSVLTGSSINIQQGRPEKTPQPTFNQTEAVSLGLAGFQLTQDEGEIRRRYRIMQELEDRQLFSKDPLEKAALQAQIEQQAQTLRSVLPAYLAEARKMNWLIPTDIQAACDHSGIG